MDLEQRERAERNFDRPKTLLCLGELIEAIDACPSPPQTEEEREEWVRKWQPREEALRARSKYPGANTLPMDTHEVKSIVDTMKWRKSKEVNRESTNERRDQAATVGSGRRGGGA
jgi:hypothetical protein